MVCGRGMKETDISTEIGELTAQTPEELSGGFADSFSSLERHVLSVADADLQRNSQGDEGDGIVALPLPEQLSLAKISQQSNPRFVREGDDLVLRARGRVLPKIRVARLCICLLSFLCRLIFVNNKEIEKNI